MGYLDHGRALIAELEQIALLPENQSRLRLYLARMRIVGVTGLC